MTGASHGFAGPRRRFLVLAGVAIAIGAFVTLYHGPGRPFLRGSVGDVAATMLVFAVLSLVRPRAPVWLRAAITLAIATAVECAQLVVHARSAVGAYVLGTAFDWWDLVAYVAGVAIAVGATSLPSRGRA